MSTTAKGPGPQASRAAFLKSALDRLYDGFNAPDSALDPVSIVRRYPRGDDREVVAFIAASLAFGRVASVMASVEHVCRLLGASPADAIRRFDPRRDGPAFEPFVHRWTRGRDVVALLWILRSWLEVHGSIERIFAGFVDPADPDVGPALERLSQSARAIDLGLVYGRARPTPGVFYFFPCPSGGSACKRLNLFLRWMVRQDAVDPGGWTEVPRRQLVVPLDTHTIRMGRCLRLTARSSPGWQMASDITTALRELDADDPVRYDFALCHLSMMGGCGFERQIGDAHCPLRGLCHAHPRRIRKARA